MQKFKFSVHYTDQKSIEKILKSKCKDLSWNQAGEAEVQIYYQQGSSSMQQSV